MFYKNNNAVLVGKSKSKQLILFLLFAGVLFGQSYAQLAIWFICWRWYKI